MSIVLPPYEQNTSTFSVTERKIIYGNLTIIGHSNSQENRLDYRTKKRG